MNELFGFLTEHAIVSSIAAAVPALLAYLASRRRTRKTPRSPEPSYFVEAQLLQPPVSRPAYSDRMAYVLAEMSALAYYQFEGRGGLLDAEAEKLISSKLDDKADIVKFLNDFSELIFSGQTLSLEFFEKVLKNSSFKLLATIDVAETQGFVCLRDVPNEPRYLIVAFRGTEKKLSDWLTDARATPFPIGKKKVHTGFHEAFNVNVDADGKTVKDIVQAILEEPDAKDTDGNPLPVFFTGHSLGGALALVAACTFRAESDAACYTYGAPRIGNYEYFQGLKTPVYRVVNSSDIVPRVPPGALMKLIVLLMQALAWATSFMPPVSKFFYQAEAWLDRLKGYRHHGDLRYLTDVETGRFENVELLPNPPLMDRAWWMIQHIAASFLAPVSHHQMRIYREKLRVIATRRNC